MGYYLKQRFARYGEAESLFLEAISILKKSLGNFHPNTLTGMGNYAYLLHEMGRDSEAETIEAELRALQEQSEP